MDLSNGVQWGDRYHYGEIYGYNMSGAAITPWPVMLYKYTCARRVRHCCPDALDVVTGSHHTHSFCAGLVTW